MSTELWKMVTGFETPDEANAELLRLRAELAAERTRREAAERVGNEAAAHWKKLADQWQADAIEAGARAEQAERERERLASPLDAVADALADALPDGVRVSDYLGAIAELKAARERAEADNAALVNEMSTALEHVSARRYGDAGEGLLAALNTAHPGAALLEEREKMRAHEAEMAESLRNALERLRALERAVECLESEADSWGHADECPADDDEEDSPPCVCITGDVRRILAEVETSRGTAYVRALEEEHSAVNDALECMEDAWPTRPATLRLRKKHAKADALKGQG